MIRLLFRFLVLLILFLTVRSIINRLIEAARGAGAPRSARKEPPAVEGGELKRDPVCGTYVLAASSISRKIKGEVVYFCSPECRDKYAG